MLVYASDSPRATAARDAFQALALPARPGTCVVFGGDGSMLRAIQRHGTEVAYFGVNCGRLGFLMNDLPGTPEVVARTVARLLEDGRTVAPGFPRLRMRATTRDGALHEARALNDVYVERMLGQTCHLRVTVDGVEVVRHMVSDGIIVATALGSTAYTYSAGGPAAHPLLRALTVTAICAHSPRLPPLILPETSVVRVEVLEPVRRPARAVADGVETADVLAVEIQGGADLVRLTFAEGHDFTSTLITKVLQGGVSTGGGSTHASPVR